MAMFYTEYTPVLGTSANAAGTGMCAPFAIDTSVGSNVPVRLVAITILDKDAQAKPIDLLFFKSAPTVASAVNATLDITDAEMNKFVGMAHVLAADYAGTSSNKFATVQPVSFAIPAGPLGVSYCLLLSQGTGTYTASGIVLKLTWSTEG